MRADDAEQFAQRDDGASTGFRRPVRLLARLPYVGGTTQRYGPTLVAGTGVQRHQQHAEHPCAAGLRLPVEVEVLIRTRPGLGALRSTLRRNADSICLAP